MLETIDQHPKKVHACGRLFLLLSRNTYSLSPSIWKMFCNICKSLTSTISCSLSKNLKSTQSIVTLLTEEETETLKVLSNLQFVRFKGQNQDVNPCLPDSEVHEYDYCITMFLLLVYSEL